MKPKTPAYELKIIRCRVPAELGILSAEVIRVEREYIITLIMEEGTVELGITDADVKSLKKTAIQNRKGMN